ncbi:MAG: LytTR family DNA-binding domain-containing protein, partial [Pseudomonadota bacterium]
ILAAFDGYDTRASLYLAALALVAAVASLSAIRALDPIACALCAIAVIFAFTALNFPSAFMDNGVYALGILLAAPLAARIFPLGFSDALTNGASVESTELILEDGLAVAYRSIVSIHSAGNYVEINTSDGGEILARDTLSNISKIADGKLLRIHRSWIVNPLIARQVKAKTGSRYFLELKNGQELPVSRSSVSDVRKRLNS